MNSVSSPQIVLNSKHRLGVNGIVCQLRAIKIDLMVLITEEKRRIIEETRKGGADYEHLN